MTISMLQIASAVARTNPYIADRRNYLEDYQTPLAKVIVECASPGESMAIWGWRPRLHVETGVLQATSESVPVWQFRPNPQQMYFVKRFVDELQQSNCRLFVDTQIPGDLSYEWFGIRGQRFDEFPQIATIVARDFASVRRVDGVTIYARK